MSFSHSYHVDVPLSMIISWSQQLETDETETCISQYFLIQLVSNFVWLLKGKKKSKTEMTARVQKTNQM